MQTYVGAAELLVDLLCTLRRKPPINTCLRVANFPWKFACPEYPKISFLDIRVVTKLAVWGTRTRLPPYIHSGCPYR